ncbi:hypothetical protein DICA1_B13982 [Diutina catenulata]
MDSLDAPPRVTPERKTSESSSASSANTHVTGGSVIHHKEHDGMAREAVQSQVLSYISHQEFDANQLYHERKQHFQPTQFNGEYTPKPARRRDSGESGYPEPTVSPIMPRTATFDRDSLSDHDNDITPTTTADYFHSVEPSEADTASVSDDATDDGDHSSQFYDEGSSFNEDDSYDYYDDDDDEILLPPSPPRSPPRELDPDKLYGIYDFSGPDPSHLALSRDEAVYLINDQDNYWWLIRKLTKEERMEKKREQIAAAERNNEFVSDIDTVSTFSDDGRIGFVPAECLETYGERLARLNCYKNEEIERFHKNPFDFDLSHPIRQMEQARKNSSSSSMERPQPRKPRRNVTFNSVNQETIFSEEDILAPPKSDLDAIRAQQRQGVVHDIRRDDLGPAKVPMATPDDDRSEVLSDVYPAEAPLVVKKKKKGPQKLNEDAKEGSPLTKVRQSLSKLGSSKEKEPKPSPPRPKTHKSAPQTLPKPDLKPSNSLSKEYRSSLEREGGTRKIKRFASPAAQSKSFKNGSAPEREHKFKEAKKKADEKDEYPRFYRPNMSSAAVHPRTHATRRTSMDGSVSSRRSSVDGSMVSVPSVAASGASGSRPDHPDHPDASSIGSFSPDTPPVRQAPFKRSPESPSGPDMPNNLQQLRRSVILERLTKMTSDIQEQLEHDYGSDSLNDTISSSSPAPEAKPDPGRDDRRKRLEKLRKARNEIRELTAEQGDAPVAAVATVAATGAATEPKSRRESLGGTPRRNSRIDELFGDQSSLLRSPRGSPKTERVERHVSDRHVSDRHVSDRSVTERHVSDRSVERSATKPSPVRAPSVASSAPSVGSASSSARSDVHRAASASPLSVSSRGSASSQDGIPPRDSRRLSKRVSSQASVVRRSSGLAKKESQASVSTITPNHADTSFMSFDSTQSPDTSLSVGGLFINNSDDDDVDDLPHGEITPLTSTNSLLLGTPGKNQLSSNGSIQEIADKRKSRQVHDMFLPVLGKFDELAEKLAELNEML